jgi:hypothetical protein
MLHFDNAPVHNTESIRENLVNFGFRSMANPPHSPDLAPYDFLFSGAMKEAFAEQHFATIDDLLMSVEAFLRGLCADFLHPVFQEWIRRLQLGCEGGGEYVE